MKAVKILGLILILCSTTYIGFAAVRADRQKIELKQSLLRLVIYMRMQITAFRTPLQTIYNEYQDPVLQNCGFTDTLRQKGFQAACSEQERLFDETTKKAILLFTTELGHGTSQEEIERCRQLEEYLQTQLTSDRDAFPAKRKLYSILGICCGIMIDIILI